MNYSKIDALRLEKEAEDDIRVHLTSLTGTLCASDSVTNHEMAKLIGDFLPILGEGRPSIRGMVALPLHVLGSEIGHSDRYAPAASTHLLWWIAARFLDDLTDQGCFKISDGDALRRIFASFSLINHFAVEQIRQLSIHDTQKDLLLRELARGWNDGVEGQFRDLNAQLGSSTIESVMASYRGKTGAPYGMAAAMAAALGGCDLVRIAEWRDFGIQLGVLRQLANDQLDLETERFEDLKNGVSTLRIVHAVQRLSTRERDEFLSLANAARGSGEARIELTRRLRDRNTAQEYEEFISPFFEQARQSLTKFQGKLQHITALHRLADQAAEICFPISPDNKRRADEEIGHPSGASASHGAPGQHPIPDARN
ncbi:polyprenyl synthetase family protein [Streptomyces sp. NPDC093595]|uniref:polyprenyl synthetase family protein n=1 Tax=Streptomyces sp. NPDC093595 TaxID=3366045 RepID=UPI0037F88DC7